MDNQHTPYVSKRKHCWKSPRKNTLKQFLDEKLELGLNQLFWENKEMKIFGVKSLLRSTKIIVQMRGRFSISILFGKNSRLAHQKELIFISIV